MSKRSLVTAIFNIIKETEDWQSNKRYKEGVVDCSTLFSEYQKGRKSDSLPSSGDELFYLIRVFNEKIEWMKAEVDFQPSYIRGFEAFYDLLLEKLWEVAA